LTAINGVDPKRTYTVRPKHGTPLASTLPGAGQGPGSGSADTVKAGSVGAGPGEERAPEWPRAAPRRGLGRPSGIPSG